MYRTFTPTLYLIITHVTILFYTDSSTLPSHRKEQWGVNRDDDDDDSDGEKILLERNSSFQVKVPRARVEPRLKSMDVPFSRAGGGSGQRTNIKLEEKQEEMQTITGARRSLANATASLRSSPFGSRLRNKLPSFFPEPGSSSTPTARNFQPVRTSSPGLPRQEVEGSYPSSSLSDQSWRTGDSERQRGQRREGRLWHSENAPGIPTNILEAIGLAVDGDNQAGLFALPESDSQLAIDTIWTVSSNTSISDVSAGSTTNVDWTL